MVLGSLALSRSTIILVVATCIPFGLAIRDTVTGKYRVATERDIQNYLHADSEDEGDGEEDYREIAERRALEDVENRRAIAEYEVREETERVERGHRIKSLYSAEVAIPGAKFEAIHLGEPAGKSEVASTADVELMLRDDGVTTYALWLRLQHRDDGDCAILERGLREAWGEPRSLNNRSIWLNQPALHRAIFSSESCELSFERIVPVESWLGKSAAFPVSLSVIGKPAKQLLESLGSLTGDTIADDQITWTVRGIGFGRNPAQVVADVRNGRVATMFVNLETDVDTQEQLSDQISKLVGKEPEIPADRPTVSVWKTTPQIELDQGTVQMSLTIGGRPAVPGGTRGD